MAVVELIGVPFDGYGRPGNQARAASALRAAGLAGAFGTHELHDGDLALPAGSPERGRATSLVNEAALEAMTDALRVRVADAVAAGRFPLVAGGDCSSLLGSFTGLRAARDAAGLVFVDGHEDTMPLDVSEDGEAANAEVGLLLGLTGGLLAGPLRAARGMLDERALALAGPRDANWRRQFNVGSLRDRGAWLRGPGEIAADPAGAGRAAVAHVRAAAPAWWLHVDLDVLDPAVFGAQGLPDVPDEPGGLDWEQLAALLTAAVAAGGCAGASVAIYDPDQDPGGREAALIVDLVGRVAAALPG